MHACSAVHLEARQTDTTARSMLVHDSALAAAALRPGGSRSGARQLLDRPHWRAHPQHKLGPANCPEGSPHSPEGRTAIDGGKKRAEPKRSTAQLQAAIASGPVLCSKCKHALESTGAPCAACGAPAAQPATRKPAKAEARSGRARSEDAGVGLSLSEMPHPGPMGGCGATGPGLWRRPQAARLRPCCTHGGS